MLWHDALAPGDHTLRVVAGEWVDYVNAVRHMSCVMYDDGTIRCEMPSPPPFT